MNRLLLSIFILILFLANHSLCEWFYPGFDTDWSIFIPMDKTRHCLWSLIILCALAVAVSKNDGTPIQRRVATLFLNISIGVSFSDVIDRLVFGITGITYADYILFPLTVITSIYYFAKNR